MTATEKPQERFAEEFGLPKATRWEIFNENYSEIERKRNAFALGLPEMTSWETIRAYCS